MRMLIEEGKLDDAVQQCCLVAASEYDPVSQKAFLRAASYGKSFLKDSYAAELAETFRNAHRKLRILNNLREPNVGMPLTSAQYDLLMPVEIVHRLCLSHQHMLAAKICRLLRISNASVLSHWANTKIDSNRSQSDGDLALVIRRVFQQNNAAVSYAKIARYAFLESNKRELAIQLLKYETQVDKKVGLLLMMNEYDLALQTAVKSQNSDYIFTALMNMREKRAGNGKTASVEVFSKAILKRYETATDLLTLYLQQQLRLHPDGTNVLETDKTLLQRVGSIVVVLSMPRDSFSIVIVCTHRFLRTCLIK